MSERKYASLEAMYDDVVEQALQNCTLCGECVRDCLIHSFTALKDQPPEQIMEKMIDFLAGRAFHEDVYLKAFSCSGCGYCSDSCPQGLDPLLVHEAAKIALVKYGAAPPEAVNFVVPGQKFNVYEILSALQMKPSEARWLKSMPEQPAKVENVLFLGCSPPALPHRVFGLLDVFEKMGVSFVALSGGELCCGVSNCLALANVKESEVKARELIAALTAFSPKRVILTCTGCYRQFTEFFPNFLDFDLEAKFYTQFLMEHIEEMTFTKALNKTVALHESCMTRRTQVTESAKKVLEAIPGLTLVEPPRDDGGALCCGGIANMTNPPTGQQLGHELVTGMMKAGADHVANTCPFCTLAFYPYVRQEALDVRDIATLVNQAMGGAHYEDKLAKYWRCETIEQIVESSKDNFEANGYTEQEMRRILPFLFPLATP